MSFFSDPDAVANYAERPVKQVPGFQALQTMATLLLAERAPTDARVLVLGAGGGLELKVFAQARPDWRFVGVDPSAPMLALARQTLGALETRVDLHEGYIDDAPDGPFDGATCLLTLHFLTVEQRLHTLKQLLLRLKPGARLVVAHHSFPQTRAEKNRWLKRYAAFAVASGIRPADAEQAITAMDSRLALLPPEQDEALLSQAGFSDVELFYAAFTFKGWVACRPG
ncbi:Carboxy-S-adenosyl-L-methionine synthase [Pseudomonas fluorescens]|uniref:Carboxy-S-adenosyl-L-methionine synthase n=1 Tax=Pseudomonas fluorescens TaxID=294 RepID=A0A5E6PND3_PSEFL|nr:class I SAM-dependent methyltransferase [Pseudomonas fluorescens]VVM43850.1 Carboxy-S-adenosyl-L-methionine synthase [Pseudomonas fluorescens]